jgi:hypothetical protein
VHRHELDGVGAADRAGVEAVLLVLGGRQVGEERRQHRLAGAVLGGRRRRTARRVGEGVEVGAGRRRVGGAGPGRDLDVEAEGALDVADEVGQGWSTRRRSARSSSRSVLEPPPALRRQRVALARGRQVVEGVDERADLRLVDPQHDRLDRVVGRAAAAADELRACRPRAARSRGPIRQRAPVSRRSSAASAVGSSSTCSVARRSATSGTASSPPRPTTSTGTSRASKAARRRGNIERLRHRTAARDQWARRWRRAVR